MEKIIALALALIFVLSFAACGKKETAKDENVLRVAASPVPHAEILAECAKILEEDGIKLEIKEFSDYVVPNTAVEEGEQDVNYFQHEPYMNQFNEEKGTHLVSVAKIHYEPMGIYAGKTKSIADLPDGAVIAVPNDPTNEARALQLLVAQGLIELKPDAGLNATPIDITSNPKNIEIKELEAAMLPKAVDEVDLSVINSNYAMAAGFTPSKDALASESADSEAAQTFANVVAVKEGDEKNEAVQKLVEVLTSDAIRDFINEKYGGSVVPIF